MISIICVYNNQKIYNDYLLKSLKSQNTIFELIALDNTKSDYKSAAEALNIGGKKAKNEFLMFVHQDIKFVSVTWLKDVEKKLRRLPNVGIVGVAGHENVSWRTVTNLSHGNPPRSPTAAIHIVKSIKVQTIDECLIIIPKKIFESYSFDENVCDNWHLYAVDYCLNIKNKGYFVYVIPVNLYHRSSGYSISDNYYITLKKILLKYKKNYKIICTTCGTWNTLCPIFIQRNIFFKSLQTIILEVLKMIPLRVRNLLRVQTFHEVYKVTRY